MFFDVCDGIFLNYCWNGEKLLNSKTLAMSKDRPTDVYVGIDVFGRGCLGDGGYNTIEVRATINVVWSEERIGTQFGKSLRIVLSKKQEDFSIMCFYYIWKLS